MRRLSYILVFLLPLLVFAQEREMATVSYVNDQSVYLKFNQTKGVQEGDTVFRETDGQACLIIQKMSSVSCLATRISDCEVQKGQQFFVRLSADAEPASIDPPIKEEQPRAIESTADSLAKSAPIKTKSPAKKGDKGYLNLALSTAATSSDIGRETYRSVFRANLRVDSLFGQDLRLEAYGNVQDFRRSYESTGDAMRANVYNLALIYHPTKHHQITVGRRLNNRIASLGAIDGLQWEGHWGGWRTGVIAGSRPDFGNYGYNFDLMQYGVYGAYDWGKGKNNGQASLGVMQQTNQGAIDRRYLYTQQSYRFDRWYFFSSAEVDLYENFDSAQAQSTFKLSSLYLSARWRATNRWTLFASYDNRQQIIFFERYDSEVERLLSEQGAREGLRFRTDYRFWHSTHLGLSYNLRTNPTAGNNSQNLQASLSQGNLPWIGGTISYRFNQNQNGQINSEINSLRYSRGFKSGQRFSVYYRYMAMRYVFRDITLDPQQFYGAEYSQSIGNSWNLGIMGEYSLIHQQNQIRLYLRLSKRINF